MAPNLSHLILFLILAVSQVAAQNPIVPPGLYMADPTARVWDDGKLYIYGSVDEAPGRSIKGAHKTIFVRFHFFFSHSLGVRGIFNFLAIQYIYCPLGL